jgi:hypothetical protein
MVIQSPLLARSLRATCTLFIDPFTPLVVNCPRFGDGRDLSLLECSVSAGNLMARPFHAHALTASRIDLNRSSCLPATQAFQSHIRSGITSFWELITAIRYSVSSISSQIRNAPPRTSRAMRKVHSCFDHQSMTLAETTSSVALEEYCLSKPTCT